MQPMGPPPAKSPEKPLLITPSASPPPTRLSSRMSDGASPTKKQRFNSIARLTPSDASSSTPRTIIPEDVQKERAASKMRLFDVWSSLAERYTVPVEEDDIINIQTGEITRDNGYLRRSKKLEFGSIALGDAPAEDYDSPEEEEDEYDIDELDAFADDVSEVSYQDTEGHPDDGEMERDVPPSITLTAADAEDLREFMNAERLRREFCGSDLDEEEVEGYTSPEEERIDSVEQSEQLTLPKSIMSEELDVVVGDEEDVTSQEEPKTIERHAVENLNRPSADPASEDELDNWNIDDANVVYPIVKEEQTSNHDRSDTDSEIEIIEHFSPSSSIRSSTSKAQQHIFTHETPAMPRSRPEVRKSSHQLYTPPQSSSSSRPSATPSRNVIDLSQPSSSSSYPSKIRSDTPRNTDELEPVSNDALALPEPHINLAYLKKGKGSRSPSKSSSEMSSKSPTKTPQKIPTARPFVLITPRQDSTQHRSEIRPTSASVRTIGESGTSVRENEVSKPSKTLKGKNKAVELSEDIQQQDSATRSPPSSVKQGKTRQQSLHDSISSSDECETPAESLPMKPLRFGVPKRRQNTGRVSPKCIKNTKGIAAKDNSGRKEISRQFQSNTSQSSPLKKRKRASSDDNSDCSDYTVPERESESSPLKSSRAGSRPSLSSSSRVFANNKHQRQKPKSRSSSRGKRSSADSASDGYYDSEFSEPKSGSRYQRRKSHFGDVQMPVPHHGYHHIPYASSHYAPQPLADPRAQLIISQAMQQLSALVGATWTPPQQYINGSAPNTPHRRHDARLPNGPFITPTHRPHTYPYMYDPTLSNATLPPESPECDSSPTKSSSGRRKSLVKRSRSRGRRVSFNLDADTRQRMEDEADGYSSPPGMRSSKNLSNEFHQGSSRGVRSIDSKPAGQKQRREKTPGRRHEPTDDVESDIVSKGRGTDQRRGRTPGPSIESSNLRQGSNKRH